MLSHRFRFSIILNLVARTSRTFSSAKRFVFAKCVCRHRIQNLQLQIADPYRYLEDPDSVDTRQFVDDQNAVTEKFIGDGEAWKKINKTLTKLWKYEKFEALEKHGSRYYSLYNTGLQNQNILYYQDSLEDSNPKIFIDPNQLSANGTVALRYFIFSKDGKIVAYALSESGSDWKKIKFRNVETNTDYPETLEHIKFSGLSWTHDEKGVFYSRYHVDGKADGSETSANSHKKLFYHRIGENQDQDVVVADYPDPSWDFSPEVSDCGNYLLLFIGANSHDDLVYVADLRKTPNLDQRLDFNKVVAEFGASYTYITNEGTNFYFETTNDASNNRVVVINIESPAKANWRTLIEEHPKNVIDRVVCVNKNKLVVQYLEDVRSTLQIHSLATGEFESKIPLELGTIYGLSYKKNSSEFFYEFESFLNPKSVYRYDFNMSPAEPVLFKKAKLSSDFHQDAYIVEQKFYHSKDGEMIPMFIVRKKGDEIKPRPCLLEGYGGFSTPARPSFEVLSLAFVELFDGILAYPGIRGGSEYGERWHDGGRLLNKQTGFDDFQAAGEFLITHNYTKKSQLAIQGFSNGGLLVTVCINQRPDLFGAAIAHVGLLDMLRYHKFTIGNSWTGEYGSPDEEEHFYNLIKYSPQLNVHTPANESQEYPATLLLTGDHDDRVSPLHSLKFVAHLQHATRGSSYQKNPLMLRVYTNTGHGSGKPVSKKIEQSADVLTFLYKTLEVDTTLP